MCQHRLLIYGKESCITLNRGEVLQPTVSPSYSPTPHTPHTALDAVTDCLFAGAAITKNHRLLCLTTETHFLVTLRPEAWDRGVGRRDFFRGHSPWLAVGHPPLRGLHVAFPLCVSVF